MAVNLRDLRASTSSARHDVTSISIVSAAIVAGVVVAVQGRRRSAVQAGDLSNCRCVESVVGESRAFGEAWCRKREHIDTAGEIGALN